MYNIDFPVFLEGADLLNILMRGINPLSALQYGLGSTYRTDSVPHQVALNGSEFAVRSDNNYDEDYVDVIKYVGEADLEQERCRVVYSNYHISMIN
jgi:hypothetical protein